MGAKHSHDDHENKKETEPTPAPAPATTSAIQPPAEFVFRADPPKFFGFPSDEARSKFQILSLNAAAVVHGAVLPSTAAEARAHPEGWALLYNSGIHGCSFNRLVQLIVDRGPTVVVIAARSADGEGPRRVFGGYNEAPWTTVAQREKAARSAAASNARAKRDGMHDHMMQRPANQANTYFGNERCFVFSVPQTEVAGEPAAVVYRARPHVNANFMYLFDAHPDEEKVGIGMGGAPPGQFAWFLDKWLERGVCRGTRCSTFHNPMLSATEEWRVDAVEVYALGFQVVENIRAHAVDSEGRAPVDTGASIRKGGDRVVDKIIMELGNMHHFYGDDPRCADSEGAQDTCAS